MQKLNVQLAITIPADQVLISKVELEQLQEQQLVGRYWKMKDLEEHTGMKQTWLKTNVLYVPKFKEQIEKFSYYPQSQGEKWAFQASKMVKFLEENFYSIFHQCEKTI